MLNYQRFFVQYSVCAIAILLFFSGTRAAAQPPEEISFQGYLSTAVGAPVDGLVDMAVRLWTDETSTDQGAFLYFEDHFDAIVDTGLFSLRIGRGTIGQGDEMFTVDFFDEPEVWLELVVEGEVLTPRRRFTTVPFAFRANIAPASVGSFEITNNSVGSQDIEDDSITGDDVSNASLTGSDIASGTLFGSHIADNALTGSDIANGSLTGSDIADESLTGADIDNGSLTGADIANGSLTSADLADAPGGDFASTSSNVNIAPGTTNVQLLTVTITAPAAGRVMVNATGSLSLIDGDAVFCEITTGTSIASSRWLFFTGGSYALTRGFDVSAGSTSFRLICNTSGFNGDDVGFVNRYMTAIYVPGSL